MFGRVYRQESGAIIVDGQHIASTQQCVHCGNHERIIRGSGKKRGWCGLCNGFVCGRQHCMQHCVPFEARIEYEEAANQKRLDLMNKLITRYPSIKDLLL